MHKVNETAPAFGGLLFDGMTIAVGDFGLCDIPENPIAAICRIGQRKIRTA